MGRVKTLAACLLSGALLGGCVHRNGTPVTAGRLPSAARSQRLSAFRSDAELTSFLRDLGRAQKRRERMVAGVSETLTVTAAATITNVQHAGVDEGDIVKLAGRYLVVLRRGRLFTIEVAEGSLRPVSALDAFGPDVDPKEAWYDEMLVSNRLVVVIGYSYERGGTELG